MRRVRWSVIALLVIAAIYAIWKYGGSPSIAAGQHARRGTLGQLRGGARHAPLRPAPRHAAPFAARNAVGVAQGRARRPHRPRAARGPQPPGRLGEGAGAARRDPGAARRRSPSRRVSRGRRLRREPRLLRRECGREALHGARQRRAADRPRRGALVPRRTLGPARRHRAGRPGGQLQGRRRQHRRPRDERVLPRAIRTGCSTRSTASSSAASRRRAACRSRPCAR